MEQTRPEPPQVPLSTKLWREWFRPLLIVLVVLGSMRSALADWNDVPSGSMLPTIVPGDRLVVNKLAWDLKVPFTLTRIAQWDHPDPGDVVVFFSPADGRRLVKRVIAGPEQQVELREGVLWIDGEPEQLSSLAPGDPRRSLVAPGHEAFLSQALGASHVVLFSGNPSPSRNFGPFLVPPGSYFVMGDNRDDSFDSRYMGAIPRASIIGRAVGVAFSLDRGRYFIPRLDRWFEAVQ